MDEPRMVKERRLVMTLTAWKKHGSAMVDNEALWKATVICSRFWHEAKILSRRGRSSVTGGGQCQVDIECADMRGPVGFVG